MAQLGHRLRSVNLRPKRLLSLYQSNELSRYDTVS
jgi:hypothetical protein